MDPAQVAQYLPPSPPAGQAQVTLPEEIKLPNGLTVLLLRNASTPTVTLSADVRAGREFDTEDKAGVADLVAGNLLSGTRTRGELALARALDDVGAGLSASASRFGVQIGGAALAKDLPTLVDVFADVLQNATFPEEQFKLSQAQALQGLRRSADDPGTVAQQVFRKTVYPKGNPWQVFATPQSVGTLTRDDLTAFYQAHYRPDTTVVTLVGDFDPAAVRALLTQKLGGWTAQGPAPTVSYPEVGKPAGVVRQNPDLPGKTQAVTYLGYQSIDRRDPRYYASLVLNQVLGGDTLSSRLGTTLRDQQGLTYGVYSGFSAGREAGPFTLVMQTNPRDTERAVQGALAILGQVREVGLTQTEVNTAKNALVSSYTVGLADPAALAGTFTGFYTTGLPLSELTQYQAKVNAVTLDQVNQAARELLDPGNIVIVTAGPK
ncbi:Zn-dependent peptidase [Deinococcus aerius]|uniref:Zn-dependent peptidase n=1 Tax=Deinococcus aerius TaxID=200253 RepID=A0A2I9D611_9DEIO|nr:pitrilysin family protein [Deinococcus aerius]GBF06126.1 Zn-dependent peptidase [Deinococcus aerius]